PGASTAVPIMLDLLAKCFPDRMSGWTPQLEKMIPSYGTQLSSNKTTARKTLAETAKELDLAV
ncbi:MAG: malate:quinone oxidoreductase, partial [Pseudolysinimonas sp.]